MNRELKVQVPTLVQLERLQVICPTCGQQVLAVAGDGRVRGYCAISRQHVDFQIGTQDGLVSAYVRGDKISVIQDRYGISAGTLYRVLRTAGVRLRAGKRTLKL